jgi:hypothetical protein
MMISLRRHYPDQVPGVEAHTSSQPTAIGSPKFWLSIGYHIEIPNYKHQITNKYQISILNVQNKKSTKARKDQNTKKKNYILCFQYFVFS